MPKQTSLSSQLLVITPNELQFHNVEIGERYQRQLTISNPLSYRVEFTIRPGNTERYEVIPSQIKLDPKSEVSVTVQLCVPRPLKPLKSHIRKDIFHIKSTFFEQKFHSCFTLKDEVVAPKPVVVPPVTKTAKLPKFGQDIPPSVPKGVPAVVSFFAPPSSPSQPSPIIDGSFTQPDSSQGNMNETKESLIQTYPLSYFHSNSQNDFNPPTQVVAPLVTDTDAEKQNSVKQSVVKEAAKQMANELVRQEKLKAEETSRKVLAVLQSKDEALESLQMQLEEATGELKSHKEQVVELKKHCDALKSHWEGRMMEKDKAINQLESSKSKVKEELTKVSHELFLAQEKLANTSSKSERQLQDQLTSQTQQIQALIQELAQYRQQLKEQEAISMNLMQPISLSEISTLGTQTDSPTLLSRGSQCDPDESDEKTLREMGSLMAQLSEEKRKSSEYTVRIQCLEKLLASAQEVSVSQEDHVKSELERLNSAIETMENDSQSKDNLIISLKSRIHALRLSEQEARKLADESISLPPLPMEVVQEPVMQTTPHPITNPDIAQLEAEIILLRNQLIEQEAFGRNENDVFTKQLSQARQEIQALHSQLAAQSEQHTMRARQLEQSAHLMRSKGDLHAVLAEQVTAFQTLELQLSKINREHEHTMAQNTTQLREIEDLKLALASTEHALFETKKLVNIQSAHSEQSMLVAEMTRENQQLRQHVSILASEEPTFMDLPPPAPTPQHEKESPRARLHHIADLEHLKENVQKLRFDWDRDAWSMKKQCQIYMLDVNDTVKQVKLALSISQRPITHISSSKPTIPTYSRGIQCIIEPKKQSNIFSCHSFSTEIPEEHVYEPSHVEKVDAKQLHYRDTLFSVLSTLRFFSSETHPFPVHLPSTSFEFDCESTSSAYMASTIEHWLSSIISDMKLLPPSPPPKERPWPLPWAQIIEQIQRLAHALGTTHRTLPYRRSQHIAGSEGFSDSDDSMVVPSLQAEDDPCMYVMQLIDSMIATANELRAQSVDTYKLHENATKLVEKSQLNTTKCESEMEHQRREMEHQHATMRQHALEAAQASDELVGSQHQTIQLLEDTLVRARKHYEETLTCFGFVGEVKTAHGKYGRATDNKTVRDVGYLVTALAHAEAQVRVLKVKYQDTNKELQELQTNQPNRSALNVSSVSRKSVSRSKKKRGQVDVTMQPAHSHMQSFGLVHLLGAEAWQCVSLQRKVAVYNEQIRALCIERDSEKDAAKTKQNMCAALQSELDTLRGEFQDLESSSEATISRLREDIRRLKRMEQTASQKIVLAKQMNTTQDAPKPIIPTECDGTCNAASSRVHSLKQKHAKEVNALRKELRANVLESSNHADQSHTRLQRIQADLNRKEALVREWKGKCERLESMQTSSTQSEGTLSALQTQLSRSREENTRQKQLISQQRKSQELIQTQLNEQSELRAKYWHLYQRAKSEVSRLTDSRDYFKKKVDAQAEHYKEMANQSASVSNVRLNEPGKQDLIRARVKCNQLQSELDSIVNRNTELRNVLMSVLRYNAHAIADLRQFQVKNKKASTSSRWHEAESISKTFLGLESDDLREFLAPNTSGHPSADAWDAEADAATTHLANLLESETWTSESVSAFLTRQIDERLHAAHSHWERLNTSKTEAGLSVPSSDLLVAEYGAWVQELMRDAISVDDLNNDISFTSFVTTHVKDLETRLTGIDFKHTFL